MNKKLLFFSFAMIASFFLDAVIADFVQKIQFNSLTQIMQWFSSLITVIFVLILISSLYLYEEKKSKYISIVALSFFASFILSYILKLIFLRPRPLGEFFNTFSFLDFSINIPDYSFPSTHTAIAFSVLPVLDKEFKKIKVFWILFSVIVGLSRIYLNMHYLSDVIFGAILGYGTGYLVLKNDENWFFPRIFH